MTDDVLASIKALEDQLRADPNSPWIREELLREYVRANLVHDVRYVVHIAEYVRRFPRTPMARCPLVQIDATICPEGFTAVEREWLKHRSEHPTDAEIARGFAIFLADTEPERALKILGEAQLANPGEAELWTDAGRICADPRERLLLFQRARSLGSSQPNLLVWIARAAVDAADLEAAERIAQELVSLTAELRAVHGDRLDWTDQGKRLWVRARGSCQNEQDASALVDAISSYANWTHWAHTTLGMVAARRGDIPAAREHLRSSTKIVGDFRLRAYGPSFRLADELAKRGEWAAVAEYLRDCGDFWPAEDLQGWISELEEQHHPDFPDQ